MSQAGGPSILVVDDESHIVNIVRLKLTNAGYSVTAASDGEEALEIALQQQPDLVITDYQMPFMDGLELCIKLKNDPATSDIPVIMLTARGYSLTPEDFDRTNIAAVLSKPFSPREVLKHVEELLSNQSAS